MNRFKLSILHGFQSLSLSLKKVAALQFFRHPPVRSVNLGIFSHLPFKKGGNRLPPPFTKRRLSPLCHSCGSRNPHLFSWIPVYTGMTEPNMKSGEGIKNLFS